MKLYVCITILERVKVKRQPSVLIRIVIWFSISGLVYYSLRYEYVFRESSCRERGAIYKVGCIF